MALVRMRGGQPACAVQRLNRRLVRPVHSTGWLPPSTCTERTRACNTAAKRDSRAQARAAAKPARRWDPWLHTTREQAWGESGRITHAPMHACMHTHTHARMHTRPPTHA